ncbi:MAG TPA: PPOX class F420-dependent oxidoreductase [Thermoleophilaceae bacterium]|nr:PPOX class F420-dependent oxidoreductase [Thermoleophilaceae bacterium]
MADSIDRRSRELLEDKNFGHIVTMGRDGSPNVGVVWVDVEGDEVLVNGAEGRVWPANLRRDPKVVLTVVNLDDPYEYTTIKGRAVEITPDGADQHIDALAKKYLDKDEYPFRQEGEVRLKVRIQPEKVRVRGG